MKVSEAPATPVIWVAKYAARHFILDSSHLLGCILATQDHDPNEKKLSLILSRFCVLVGV